MKKYFFSPRVYLSVVLGVATLNILSSTQSNMLGVTRPVTGYILPTFFGFLIGLLLSINNIRDKERAKDQKNFFIDIVQALSTALDMRDAYTFGHSSRVTQLSVALGNKLNLPTYEIEALELGSILHDIGKIGISDSILQKPDKLTPAEFSEIQTHPYRGVKILKASKNVAHRMVLDCIHYHHENFNGTGYPNKLKGNDIPLLARIISIADAFDAMISTRPYRKRAMTVDQALEELSRCSGTQFDPILVEKFCHILTSGEVQFNFEEDEMNSKGGISFTT